MNVRLLATSDAETLTYSLISAPDWLDLTERGIMTYRPAFDAAGVHEVTAEVFDGHATTRATWEITVKDLNQIPVIVSKPDNVAKEGEVYRYKVAMSDKDDDDLTLSLIHYPEGMRLEGDTLVWSVDFQAAGEHAVLFQVSDGKDSTEQAFGIQVEDTNRLPEFETAVLPAIAEGSLWSKTIDVSDADGDNLTVTLESGPSGLSVDNNTLIFHPDYEQAGEYSLALKVSDGKDSRRIRLPLTVKDINRLPELPPFDWPPVDEGSVFEKPLVVEDPDGDEIHCSIENAPDSLSVSANCQLTFRPDYHESGDYSPLIVLSDGKGSRKFRQKVTVNHVNRPPEFLTDVLDKAKEDRFFQARLQATDPDGDAMTWQLFSGPPGMILTDTQSLQWMPDFNSAGIYSVVLVVNDGELKAERTLTLHVENTNRLPEILTNPPLELLETDTFEYLPVINDPDNDELQVELIKKPNTMRIEDNRIIWQTGYEDAGSVDVAIKVSEKARPEAFVTQQFSVNVENLNRVPVIRTEHLDKGKEGDAFRHMLQATDADKQMLRFSLVSPPAGLSVTETGELAWIPGFDQAGEHEVTFVVNDGETEVIRTLPLEVHNTNRAPVWTSTPDIAAKENHPWVYSLVAEDADADPLTFRLPEAPEGVTLNGSLLQWMPGFEQSGKHSLTLEVGDGETVVKQQFVLDVENTNRLPQWSEPAESALQLKENSAWTLALQATDKDRQKVAYRLLTEVPGLTLKGHQLLFKPTYEQAGFYDIQVEAFDGEEGQVMDLALSVENTNRQPAFISTPPEKGAENTHLTYDLKATDPDKEDADLLTFSLQSGPSGMTVDGSTLNWLPDFDAAGRHEVILAVSDAETSRLQRFTLDIANTNRAPVFESEALTSVDEMQAYRYPPVVSDPDGQQVSLSLDKAPEGLTLEDGMLSFSPDYYAAGVYPVHLSITDGDLTTRQHFDLVVNNVNRLPVFTSEPGLSGYEDVVYRYTIAMDDADGEDLTLSLVAGPTGMRLNNGVIAWRPGYEQAGRHEVSLAITDGIDTVLQTFTLSIANTNREPDFQSIADQDILPDRQFIMPLRGSDVDGTPVAFRHVHAPETMSINDKNELLWKPRKDDRGKHTVIISVSDGDLKIRRYFDIYVGHTE